MSNQLLSPPAKAGETGIEHSFAVDFISSIYPVSERYKEILREKGTIRHLKKGELLVRKGQVCTSVCFIKKGLMRGFVQYDKTDITTWISCENELVTSITGFFKNNPAKENIQAIEHSELECLDAKDLALLYEECPEANIVTRLILEKYYEDAENRAFISRLPSLAEKYKYLHQSDSYRHILTRAPLKYVASFLSVRLETLSRLRGKYSRRPSDGAQATI
jgi:CRP-like cAMP-binding protein